MFQGGDHGHQAGSAIGVRSVIGGKPVEELHQVRLLQSQPIQSVERVEQVGGLESQQGGHYGGVSPGLPPVQGLVQEDLSCRLEQVPGMDEVFPDL